MHCYVLCVFFFFKQKTAYEMRISDWSSDVCSSDLSGEIWVKCASKGPPCLCMPICVEAAASARILRFGHIDVRDGKHCPRIPLVGEVSLTGVFCVAGLVTRI